MSDSRIVMTIDYEPHLGHYPQRITSKREAMEFDVSMVVNGQAEPETIVGAADDIVWSVEDLPKLWTCVFAETEAEAEELAESLGLFKYSYKAYSVHDPAKFEGARANRAIIKTGTKLSVELEDMIWTTVCRLYSGTVFHVDVREPKWA